MYFKIFLIAGCFFVAVVQGMEQKEVATPSVKKVDEVSKAIEEATIQYYAAELKDDEYLKYMVLKNFNVAARLEILLGSAKMQCEAQPLPEDVYLQLKKTFYKKKTTAKRQVTHHFLEHVCGGTSGQNYQDLKQVQERLGEQALLKIFHNFRPRPYCY